MAFGGGDWVAYINDAGAGVNATATAIFKSGRALEVNARVFDQLSVTNASVYDYTAAATVDYQQQLADQAAWRKISMPTHVLYSYSNLPELSGFDAEKTWARCIDSGADLSPGPVCCGQGHFIIELAPDQAVAQLNAFMDRLGVAEGSV